MRRAWMIGTFTALVMAAGVMALPVGKASAGWLSRLMDEAGEAGARVAGRTVRETGHGLDGVARHVTQLPPLVRGESVLAAHAGSEGHWTFVNRAGERFTAATPEERARMRSVLAPEAGEAGALRLVVSADTVFAAPTALKDLPTGARLEVLYQGKRYPLLRQPDGAGARIAVALRPRIAVLVRDETHFAEMAALLDRPLAASRLRMLSLEPGGPQTLQPRGGGTAPAATAPEAIDPFKLADAFATLKGQTALVSGRIEGAYLKFKPASGAEQTILVDDIRKSARSNDVDLLIVQSAGAEQPGARNWLFQQIAVAGVDAGRPPKALGDLIDALAEKKGGMVAEVTAVDADRVRIVLAEGKTSASGTTGALTQWFDEIVQTVVGNVVTTAIDLDARSEARTKELAARLVPGVPSTVQFGYAALIVAGLMGLGHARAWWRRMWPPEARGEYGSVLGYWAAGLARLVAFVLVFLPLAGGPALIASLFAQALTLLTLPLRALQWITARLRRVPQ